MQNNLTFSDFVNDIYNQFNDENLNNSLVSVCIEIPPIDILEIYNYFQNLYPFSFFWEENHQLSFIALDKCEYKTLNGPNKYSMAKKFCDETFKNLINLNKSNDIYSLSKIIYFFSFNDYVNKKSLNEVPLMEAVLPRILIIKNDNKVWFRMHSKVTHNSSLKKILEEFWFIRSRIIQREVQSKEEYLKDLCINKFNYEFDNKKEKLREIISKGIQLVEEDVLEKIVLCTRLSFNIENRINIYKVLKNFQLNQPNSCRYLWKRSQDDITFGASPEKLFSIKQNNLLLEAIAGTSKINNDKNLLLKNLKNLNEHNFVINYLIISLKKLGIENYIKDKLRVKSFGQISHLCTSISANVDDICPFKLLEILHPSPALSGFPKKISLNWIDILENFSRGNYASPIGWVDSNRNADFRVAIRGARIINKVIELTAGSGIIKGSTSKLEIEEIKLKFETVANEIFTNKANL